MTQAGRRMRVLMCTHSFAPHIGGAETLVMLLASGLSDAFDVTVATPTHASGHNDSQLPFPVLRRPGTIALWNAVRAADIVHLAGPLLRPMLLARLARTPVIIEHHAYQAVCLNGLLLQEPDGRRCVGHFLAGQYGACVRCRAATTTWREASRTFIRTLWRRRLLHGARAHIAVSRHVAGRLQLPVVEVIPHGVSASRRAHVTSRADAADASLRFVFVGRLVREKGVDILLKATAALQAEGKSFTVRIIGDGPERGRLEALATQLALKSVVEFTGTQSGPDLSRLLDMMHVLVMPSVWEEPAGFSAIEAMSRGTPVIASAVGGLSEIVGDAGILVTPNSPGRLADAMRDLCDNPARVALLSARASARAAREFTVDAMLNAHKHIWQRVALA